MGDDVEITGLPLGEVLAVLVNNTLPLGLGALDPKAMVEVTPRDCDAFIAMAKLLGAQQGHDVIPHDLRFDYVFGRPIKVHFVKRDDKVFVARCALYTRDSGIEVSALVDELRARK